MHRFVVRGTVYLLVALAITACADGMVSPPVPPGSSRLAASNGKHVGEVPFTCSVLRKSSTDATWAARTITLHYPSSEIAARGRTVPYRIRGTTASGEVVFAAFCTVPYTEPALRRVDRRFGVKHGGGADQFAAREGLIETQGCVTDGMCVIDPIVVVAPPAEETDEDESGTDAGGGGSDGENGGGSGDGRGGDACDYTNPQLIAEDPNCHDPEYPTSDEEADATSCPATLSGKVITALITVAGRSHEFRFEGPMMRTGAARSPATYVIRPTVSRDAWWIAESGTIKVNCNGYYSPSAFGYRVWIGVASYAGQSDLHMVLGPNHPTF